MTTRTRPTSPARLVTVVAAVLLALVAGWLLRPTPAALPDGPVHGDAELAVVARELVVDGPSALAVGVVQGGQVRTASIGAPLDGTYEIGSVNKGITGMLYVDAVERGEVEPGTTLGEIFDLGDVPAAEVTLEQLSTHTSGLPRLAGGVRTFAVGAVAILLGRNPDRESTEELLAHLRTVGTEAGVPTYSNFGFSVLGHALAERAGLPYERLVAERIAGPLGLGSVTVPASVDDLDARAVQGRDASGRRQQAWTGLATAPAGGIRADVGDMTTLAAALLSGEAPGSASLEPVADYDGHRIGAAWLTTEDDGFTYTWHNGGTGGFRTWLGMHRESGTAVVLMAATSESVDAAGLQLLKEVSR